MVISVWVFVVSFAACAYVYAGYPALLGVLARFRRRPVRRAPIHPRITVIIPAFNEEAVIEHKVRATLANGYPNALLDIIVASDGSTDRTNDIVRRLEGRRLRLLALPRGGKVAALNAAVAAARGEIVVFTDADVELEAGALAQLVSNFADPTVGGVTGRKVHPHNSEDTAIGRGEGLYARFDEWQKGLESDIGSTVAAHGALHAIRTELYVPVLDSTVADDIAISARVVLQGRRLIYEPNALARVERPVDVRAEFRRKVRIANQVIRALLGLGHALWSSGFYSVQLVSHKLLRYCVPVFLLVMLIANTALALDGRMGWQFLLVLQGGFYGAAAIGLLLGDRWSGKWLRVLTVPYYFCAVNAAALVALVSVARGERSGTWTPGAGFEGGATPARIAHAGRRSWARTPAT
jgi:cellulose synthase/poly-beta-1,6-N-acetylglucosamine synthase-like glycosyltransferase